MTGITVNKTRTYSTKTIRNGMFWVGIPYSVKTVLTFGPMNAIK